MAVLFWSTDSLFSVEVGIFISFVVDFFLPVVHDSKMSNLERSPFSLTLRD